MKTLNFSSRKNRWVGGLEIGGMLLILISFYYQSFYEGDALRLRYDNIRFKLQLIQNEIIQNKELDRSVMEYNLGNYWKKFDSERVTVNELSDEYISTVDEISRAVASVKSWVFIMGSMLLILSKFLSFYWKE